MLVKRRAVETYNKKDKPPPHIELTLKAIPNEAAPPDPLSLPVNFSGEIQPSTITLSRRVETQGTYFSICMK